MPVYEYLCRACDTRFEARRPMAEASAPMSCPAGHADTTRVLSVFASLAASASGASPALPAGGCGPGCHCAS
jgi:putative FmdB family regulatory protein